MMKHVIVVLAFACAPILMKVNVEAQWSSNPDSNTVISAAAGNQSTFNSSVVSDGVGGAIIAWEDFRNGSTFDIYAQRINEAGEVQWTIDGLAISTAVGHQEFVAVATDGHGGAIITWRDQRNGPTSDIYAQRVSIDGNVIWATDGIPICTAAQYQDNPAIVSDGLGGAIITWEDRRANGISYHLYAQRVNATGVVQWTTDGVAVCATTGNQRNPKIVSDGSKGAIITFQNALVGGSGYDIYAQRITSAGAVQWGGTNGIAISAALNNQLSPAIISAGDGSAIITWEDQRLAVANVDIYAQRVSSLGAVQWGTDGVPVCVSTNNQASPNIASDGTDGAIITWVDFRTIVDTADVYAQRLSSTGTAQWTTDGVPISLAPNNQTPVGIINDLSGGAIIELRDSRSGLANIYAQRIDHGGNVGWTVGGVRISSNGQGTPAIVRDGAGGAIMAWGSTDVYAQNVDRNGNLGINIAVPTLTTIKDVPGDQGGEVTVVWDRSVLDESPEQIVTYYSIWRSVGLNVDIVYGNNDNPAIVRKDFPGKAYRSFSISGTNTSWEWLANIPAHYLAHYQYVAPTTSDSTSGGAPYFKFFISAQTDNPFVFWDSNIDSGYSVDNLSPAAPQSVVAIIQSGPSVHLHWAVDTVDHDLSHYKVYRSVTSGFAPSSVTKIGSSSGNIFTDVNQDTTVTNYYRIVAVDVHGNQSAASVEVAALPTVIATLSITSGWNMVSVPLTVTDYAKTVLYPSAGSNAFSYNGNYNPASTLKNGIGYWLKFDSSQTVAMSGTLRFLDTVTVTPGWNMIGSISQSIPVSGMTSLPPGLVTSQFFGYAGSYSPSSTLDPGKAYWVKVAGNGQLILTSSSSVEKTNTRGRINIIATTDRPPAPPESNIEHRTSDIPREFALEQNYPNPFNPTTTIRYQLPEDSKVTLKVYDILGREVVTMVDAIESAGYKVMDWNSSAVGSGVYFCRLQATSLNGSENYLSVKKMLLLR